MNCSRGCCSLKITEWKDNEDTIDRRGTNRNKAGMLLYDSGEDKILIVQSRGNMWGIPKGTRMDGESFEDCAIREVLEETGIVVERSKLETFVDIQGSRYFIINHDTCAVEVQDNPGNDANGIGWIRVDCLLKTLPIKLTSHTFKLLEKLFKV